MKNSIAEGSFDSAECCRLCEAGWGGSDAAVSIALQNAWGFKRWINDIGGIETSPAVGGWKV